MINKLLIKTSLIVILFFLTNQQVLSFIKTPTTGNVINKCVKSDPLFRFCLGKAMIVNGANIHSELNKKNKNYCEIAINTALLTAAGITFATYPPSGTWEAYTSFGLLSPEKTTFLKLATVASVINTCTYGRLTKLSKQESWNSAAKIEAITSALCCFGATYSLCGFSLDTSLSSIKLRFSFIR